MTKAIYIFLWIMTCFAYHSTAQVHIMDTASTITNVTMHAQTGSWETVKQNKGITIKYRSIKLGKSTKTRELSTHFTVEAHPDSILAYLRIPEKQMQWDKGVKAVRILEQDSISWITHTMYNIPFPISQQDVVVKNIVVKTENKFIINITSTPHFIPLIEDVDRVKHYIAQWVIFPLENNQLDVTFSAITLSKSYIPKFIKDPLIQNNLLKSVKAFKLILTQNK